MLLAAPKLLQHKPWAPLTTSPVSGLESETNICEEPAGLNWAASGASVVTFVTPFEMGELYHPKLFWPLKTSYLAILRTQTLLFYRVRGHPSIEGSLVIL